MDSFLITQAEIDTALGYTYDKLEDYDPTIFGLIWDGAEWSVHEDSLDEPAALEWANRCAGYGEHVGLYVWSGTRDA